MDEIWREWVSKFDDEEAFSRRLDREGWSESDCREAIRARQWPADHPLPDWIEDLTDLVSAVSASSATTETPALRDCSG